MRSVVIAASEVLPNVRYDCCIEEILMLVSAPLQRDHRGGRRAAQHPLGAAAQQQEGQGEGRQRVPGVLRPPPPPSPAAQQTPLVFFNTTFFAGARPLCLWSLAAHPVFFHPKPCVLQVWRVLFMLPHWPSRCTVAAEVAVPQMQATAPQAAHIRHSTAAALADDCSHGASPDSWGLQLRSAQPSVEADIGKHVTVVAS